MASVKPVVSVDATVYCPDLSSLPASFSCDCHITTRGDFFIPPFTPSGDTLTIACGDKTGTTQGSMDSTAVSNLINLIPPTTPMDHFAIYRQSNVLAVPANLKKFTTLRAVSFPYNSITSVDAADLSWPGLQYVNLLNCAISTITGQFNLTYPFQADGSGSVLLFLTAQDSSNNNPTLTSLSQTKFFLSADNVFLDLSMNGLTTITADMITMQAKNATYLGLNLNPSLTSVKLAADTNAPLSQGQQLLLGSTGLTGTIDCNDLGINDGVALFKLDVSDNTISGASNCGAGSKLDSAKSVYMDWSKNSFTSLSAGAFNFAANVTTFKLNNQKTAFTSIAPGALPSELILHNFSCLNKKK